MNAERLVSLTNLARLLGVPAKWLREEATAGRIPHLKAGTRLLFNAAVVKRTLLKRATDEGRVVTNARG